jgi:hypothetical protein
MTLPSWLPALVDTHYGSDREWEKLVAFLYQIFSNDFIQNTCRYGGIRIIFDNRKINSPYEEGFWHLISKDDPKVQDRLFDPERASRLPWCRLIIEHQGDPEICIWNYVESNGRVNTYLWLVNYDYLIILQRRKNVMFMVTAFWVAGKSSRNTLTAKYQKRVI